VYCAPQAPANMVANTQAGGPDGGIGVSGARMAKSVAYARMLKAAKKAMAEQMRNRVPTGA